MHEPLEAAGDLLRRGLDVLIAATAAVAVAPLSLLIGAAVWATVGRPLMLRQVRIGRCDRPFVLFKWRTMHEAVDQWGEPLPDHARLSKFGSWLRSTSLDEIPSLWNVIKGDMSLVGPRPLLPQYLPLYSPRQARRHEVRPGITGWAQVNGRNAVDWATRLEMDVWYVENQSLLLDLKILGMTVIKVLRREGINQPGSATMEPFTGQGADG